MRGKNWVLLPGCGVVEIPPGNPNKCVGSRHVVDKQEHHHARMDADAEGGGGRRMSDWCAPRADHQPSSSAQPPGRQHGCDYSCCFVAACFLSSYYYERHTRAPRAPPLVATSDSYAAESCWCVVPRRPYCCWGCYSSSGTR